MNMIILERQLLALIHEDYYFSDSLLFCGFEQDMTCEVGGDIELRNSTGSAENNWLHKWQANSGELTISTIFN